MRDLGPYFDDKPFARTVLKTSAAAAAVALCWGIWAYAIEPIPKRLAQREFAIKQAQREEVRRAGWNVDWRKRPSHEIEIDPGLEPGEHPTIFRMECDYDRSTKSDFARAFIEDEDGIPGLGRLTPGDTISLDIKIGRDSWFKRVWTVEAPNRLVSDDRMHFRLQSMRYNDGDIATLRMQSPSGHETQMTLPLTGANAGTKPFFSKCIEKSTRRG